LSLIANELEGREYEDESSILDEVILDLVAEKELEKGLRKESDINAN